MTTITSIILSAFLGLSQNAGYTGISGIQCNPLFTEIGKSVLKGVAWAFGEALAANLLNGGEESENNFQTIETTGSNNSQSESNDEQSSQKLENWHKDFQPDNDTEQDKTSQTSQKGKQKAGKKASRKNRRKQIEQLPLPERENQDDEMEIAVLGEIDYSLLY